MRHNRYSSWFNAVISINSNQNNINIYNLINSQTGWNPSGINKKKLRAFITIQPGVVVSSTSSTTPALSLPSSPFRSYDLIWLINHGTIAGKGGAGGIGVNGGAGNNGAAGGLAMDINRSLRLDNLGTIAGGGGGGGAGGATQLYSVCDYIPQCTCCNYDGWDACPPLPGENPVSGCGGAANDCWWGVGGSCSFTHCCGPDAGKSVTGSNVARGSMIPSLSLGGNGGSGQGPSAASAGGSGSGTPSGGSNVVGNGGSGGTYGQPGSAGTSGGSYGGGSGGAAGKWIDGYSNLIVINAGTVFGASIN